jgi:hypothetical protein
VAGAVVDHAIANKECRERMGQAYALNKEAGGHPNQEQVDELNDRLEVQFPVVKPESGNAPGAPPKQAPRKPGKKVARSPKEEPSGKRQRKLTDYKAPTKK